jgi:peptide/nickel transport system substrate-binding protein
LPQQSWDLLSSSGTVGNYDASAETRSPVPNTSPVQHVPTNPGTASTGALGVAQFLNTQSQDLSTYATNPLWQVVNGPFKLSQFTTGGFVNMVPNKNYSGSPKPTISAFEELPYTSDTAEFDQLRSAL